MVTDTHWLNNETAAQLCTLHSIIHQTADHIEDGCFHEAARCLEDSLEQLIPLIRNLRDCCAVTEYPIQPPHLYYLV